MNVRAEPAGTDQGQLHATLASASVREILMGAQDNLTNVLAVVLGVSIGAGRVELVALAGLAAAVAEAISMAGVLYTATLAEQELDAQYGATARPRLRPLAAGAVCGLAALVAGLIPLLPFAVLPLGAAVIASLIISLAALFALGMLTAGATRGSWRRSGLRLVAIGGSAAAAAALIGVLLRV